MSGNPFEYSKQVECYYKAEMYSVRDNGAVLRHLQLGKTRRALDNNWTFGKLNTKTGYLEIASVRVHRIVATAFHGNPPTKEHVCDHIDTNKQNNRPENLRWVTRLENILLNPITAKRIAIVCGNVEAFLTDPSKFKDRFKEPNMKWMKTVSVEEAQISKERLLTWAMSDKTSFGMTLDDWIFKVEKQEPLEFFMSLTQNAIQKNWKTPSEFPSCPLEISKKPVRSYADSLKVGEMFSKNNISIWIVAEFAISKKEDTLWVVCNSQDQEAIKPWSLAQVTFENNLFVHENLGTFFEKRGAQKQFTLVQGKVWYGGDSLDDFT